MHSAAPTFFDAWVEAASGPHGFWPTSSPASHFRTASALGPERALEIPAEGGARRPLDRASASWVDTWWPSSLRVEVGLTRDLAWSALVAGLSRTGGLALLVDYGHQRASRPAEGTLAGYRDGRRVLRWPTPDAT